MTPVSANASDEPKHASQKDDYSFGLIVVLALVLVVSFAIGQGNNGAAAVATVVFFLGLIAMYFAPAAVAVLRQHPNMNSIVVLDLLLGWTFIGWVAALVWAYSSARAVESAIQMTDADMRACPFCAEPIRAAAVKCKHCGSDVSKAAILANVVRSN